MNLKNILTILIVISFIFSSFVGLTTAKSIKNQNVRSSDTTYRALLIANQFYDGPHNDLSTPGYDVESIESVLLKSGYDTIKLKNSDATKINVNTELNKLSESTEEKDITLIYFNGHGKRKNSTNPVNESNGDDTEEYIWLYGYGENREYRDDLFIDKIMQIKGKKIVILDSCFSSGFRNDLKMVDDGTVVLITAHAEKESLYEIPSLKKGLLSMCVVHGLATEDTDDNDKVVTIEEFVNNAQDRYDITIMNFFNLNADHEYGLRYYPDNLFDLDIKNTNLILFENSPPSLKNNIEDCFSKRGNKVTFRGEFLDHENDEVDIYISWGDGESVRTYSGDFVIENMNFDRILSSSSDVVIEKIHTYKDLDRGETKEYNYFIFYFDEHGSFQGEEGAIKVTKSLVKSKYSFMFQNIFKHLFSTQ